MYHVVAYNPVQTRSVRHACFRTTRLQGSRKSGNRQRGIVPGKVGPTWVFVFLFAKRDRDNIDARELRAVRKRAPDVGRHADSDIATRVALKEWVEICNG